MRPFFFGFFFRKFSILVVLFVRRKFSIVVAHCAGENFRSWWWRSKSSPLQVSGAVTRLAVYRAAPHNLQRRGYYSVSNLQRRGYYSVSNIQPRENVGKVGTQFREKFRWSFVSRWKFRNSFLFWLKVWCSLWGQRDFLKVSGRLKFSRYRKIVGELPVMRPIFFEFFFENFRSWWYY